MTTFGRLLRIPWFAVWRLIRRLFYDGREYTVYVPFGCRTLSPWFSNPSVYEPQEALTRSINRQQTTTPDRAYYVYELCRSCVPVEGHVAECGVFRGATADVLCRAITQSAATKQLHLFDTFVGMTDATLTSRDFHSVGDFSRTSLDFVKSRLNAYDFVTYYPGNIPEVFQPLGGNDESYAFVHVDLVNYRAVLACCEWFWPRLRPGGIVLVDDYGFYAYRDSVRAAVDDFVQDRNSRPIVLHTGQAVLIRAV